MTGGETRVGYGSLMGLGGFGGREIGG